MLPAQVLQELIRRLGASRLYVLVAFPDAGDGLLTVLPRPIEVRRQCLVESFGRGCSAPPCEILEFGEPFRPDRKCAHRSNGRRVVPGCQGSNQFHLPSFAGPRLETRSCCWARRRAQYHVRTGLGVASPPDGTLAEPESSTRT